MTYGNTFIRTIYSPGLSCIMISFYKTGLTLAFKPWSGDNRSGYYDKNKFLSTTIDYEKAAALWMDAKDIVDNNHDSPRQLVLECNKQTILRFEYDFNQSGQMRAVLTIEKNGDQIPFEFIVYQYRTKEHGQVVNKEMQVGLGAFMKVLDAYLSAVGASLHLNKMTEEELGDPLDA